MYGSGISDTTSAASLSARIFVNFRVLFPRKVGVGGVPVEPGPGRLNSEKRTLIFVTAQNGKRAETEGRLQEVTTL
jgi:hypothetical protein